MLDLFESSTFYLVVAGVGFAYLMLVLLLGEVLDLDGLDLDLDAEPSWLDLKAISGGAVGFGLVGYLSIEAGVPILFTIALSIVGFVLMLVASLFFVLRPLFRQQSNSQLSRETYVGKLATVSLTIREGDWGEVQFSDKNNALVKMKAVSNDGSLIPQGTTVVIVNIGESDVTVTPAEF